jgi:hypothetical protein
VSFQSSNQSQRDNADHERRKALCCATPAQKILIKISGIDLGLRRVHRTSSQEKAAFSRATAENLANQTQPQSYRRSFHSFVDDSGYQPVSSAGNVMFDHLIRDMKSRGYAYTDGHSFVKPNNDNKVINVLEFTLGGSAITMPTNVLGMLETGRFNAVFVWCNPKNLGSATKPDTINAKLAHVPASPKARLHHLRLVPKENSYRLL